MRDGISFCFAKYKQGLRNTNDTGQQSMIMAMNEDPVTFWNDLGGSSYAILSSLAVDVLCIPSTSAPIERVFSQASIACGSKRNRLSGPRLERETMMKMNKRFF